MESENLPTNLYQGPHGSPAGAAHDMFMYHQNNLCFVPTESSQAVSTMDGPMYRDLVARLQQEMLEGDDEDATPFEQLETSFAYSAEEEVHSAYPEEVTPGSITEPYWPDRTPVRALDQRFMSSNIPGFSFSYPHRQDMSVGYQGQAWLYPDMREYVFESDITSNNSHILRRSLPPTENGFGGPALRSQPSPQYNGNPSAPGQVPPNANAFGYVDGAFVPLFADENEYHRRNASKEKDRRECPTYPRHDATKRNELLGRLYKAFRNTAGVQESKAITSKFSDDTYSDERIHEACWEVLIQCRDSQEFSVLRITKSQLKDFTKKHTFAERIESVIETLRDSKLACRSVLARPFLERLADQPEKEGKQKVNNKGLNYNKTIQNKMGQKAITANCATKEGVWIGPPCAAEAEHQPEPEQGEASTGRRGRRKREDDGDETAARKRTRH